RSPHRPEKRSGKDCHLMVARFLPRPSRDGYSTAIITQWLKGGSPRALPSPLRPLQSQIRETHGSAAAEMYLARAGGPEIRSVKHGRSIRIVLFEDVWEIALQNPLPTSLVPPKLLAKIKAAPRNTESARAQRELICAPREAQQLLRIYTVAASAYAVLDDS